LPEELVEREGVGKRTRLTVGESLKEEKAFKKKGLKKRPSFVEKRAGR